MKAFTSCKRAMDYCLDQKYFAIAHLYHDEKPMSMHIHDSYEIYYSISGGKQFLIDNKFYTIAPGDIFFINHYESHHLCQIDSAVHERIVLSIAPEFLVALSTPQTDLNQCFFDQRRNNHRVTLTPEDQKRFLYYIHKLTHLEGYGEDLIERATFTELMVFLNRLFVTEKHKLMAGDATTYHDQVEPILLYINQHLEQELTIQELADQFFISTSYLCRIFKATTGTTINKYITARRISIAKSLLAQGCTVTESCERCGYQDYSNFIKAFTQSVGISPKKYAQFVTQH